MSQRDIAEYGQQAQRLCGHKFELTVATNSLKLTFTEAGRYLWVDPPWGIVKDGIVINGSHAYPADHEASDYEHRFQVWADQIHALIKAFDSIQFRNARVLCSVGAGAILRLAEGDDPRPDAWYDHWYVGESGRAT
jgi:hypothetical protein